MRFGALCELNWVKLYAELEVLEIFEPFLIKFIFPRSVGYTFLVSL